MKVLVDSSVWSLVFRRKRHDRHKVIPIFEELIREGRVVLAGPVRQEILSGIRTEEQFQILREQLRSWTDLDITTDDYERAAQFFNICRANGIQGTHNDFLICAIATRYDLAILTTDKDFANYALHLPIRLFVDI